METNIEWYDAREVLPPENQMVIVEGLEGLGFVCTEPFDEDLKKKSKFFWTSDSADQPEYLWHPVTQYPPWRHWPTVNDEGCVG